MDRAAARRDLPSWKSVAYSLIVAALFFGTLEGVLALAGVKPAAVTQDPYVGFAANSPLFVERRLPSGETVLATADNKRRYFNRQQFAKTKGRGTIRIFCLGGSTTYGHPYDDATSFCGWLRAFLTRADPSGTYEVINAGGVSYASYRVVRLMEELSRHQPDIFIIYSAHNEFLERRTYSAIIERHPVVAALDSRLGETRIYTALKSAHAAVAGGTTTTGRRDELAGEVDALLDASVGPDAYRRDDQMRERILEHYRFNLGRMADIAAAARAALVFVAPAANLMNFSPFKSEPSPGLTPQQHAAWREAYDRGAALADDGDASAALGALAEAARVNPRHAETLYRLGRALVALGRHGEAAEWLRRARDEDITPLRALGAMHGIVLEVARSRGVPAVDFEAMLARRSARLRGHPLLGEADFLDHVHPTVEANRLLALDLVDLLFARGLAGPPTAWDQAAIAETVRSVEDRIDRRAHAAALRNVAKVLSWGGKTDDAAAIARRVLGDVPEDAESLFILGFHAQTRGRLDEAIDLYHRSIRADPDYAKPRNNLGIALARAGRAAEAVDAYRELLRLRPDHDNARYNLANALVRLGDDAAAAAEYRAVLRVRPDDADARHNLAAALARLDRHGARPTQQAGPATSSSPE